MELTAGLGSVDDYIRYIEAGEMCIRDRISLANQVEALAAQFPNLDIKVAVMGCVVNGPGEAKEADLGIACLLYTSSRS